MKQIIKLTENELKEIIKESINELREIEVTPPKRDSRLMDLLDYVSKEHPEGFTDNPKSDFPLDWLTDYNYYRAHRNGEHIKPEKRKFDKNGFDQFGRHKITGSNYDENGFNILGIDKDGYKKDGYGLGGWDRDGFNKQGRDKEGYNRDGFKNGIDREGYNRKGFDKNGLDRNGIDKNGDKRGKRTWKDVITEYVNENWDEIKNMGIVVAGEKNKYWDFIEEMHNMGRAYSSIFPCAASKAISRTILKKVLEKYSPNTDYKSRKALSIRNIIYNKLVDNLVSLDDLEND